MDMNLIKALDIKKIHFDHHSHIIYCENKYFYLQNLHKVSVRLFPWPLPHFHQLIDLMGAKNNHAMFQRPLPQGCRLS